MEMHLAVDLLLFCKWRCVLFLKDGSQSLQGNGIRGVGGGLPGIGMTTQLGMRRAFIGWNSGDQLEVYLGERQKIMVQLYRHSIIMLLFNGTFTNIYFDK